MNKLTDNEIVKALECCIKGEGCKPCPLLNFGGNEGDCADELTKQSFDLINRQKAEIERLEKRRKPTETSGFVIENGKVVFYVDLLGKYRHEFRDLDEVVEELNLMLTEAYKTDEIAGYLNAIQENFKNAKANAIK